MDATTAAVDVAKTVFEIAIANREGRIVAPHRFNRRQFANFLATTAAVHVVMEACGDGTLIEAWASQKIFNGKTVTPTGMARTFAGTHGPMTPMRRPPIRMPNCIGNSTRRSRD